MADNEDLTKTPSMLPDRDWVDFWKGDAEWAKSSAPSLLRQAREKAGEKLPPIPVATSKAQDEKVARIWAMDPDSREAYFKKAPGDRRLFEADRQLMLTQTLPGQMSYERYGVHPDRDFSLDASMEPDSPVYYDEDEAYGRYAEEWHARQEGAESSPITDFYHASKDASFGAIPLVDEGYGPPGESWQSREPGDPQVSLMEQPQIQELMRQPYEIGGDVAEVDQTAQEPVNESVERIMEATGMDVTAATAIAKQLGYLTDEEAGGTGADAWSDTDMAGIRAHFKEGFMQLSDYTSEESEAGKLVDKAREAEGAQATIRDRMIAIGHKLYGHPTKLKEISVPGPWEGEEIRKVKDTGLMGEIGEYKKEAEKEKIEIARLEATNAEEKLMYSRVAGEKAEALRDEYFNKETGKIARAENLLRARLDDLGKGGSTFWSQFDPFTDPDSWDPNWGNIGRLGLAATSVMTLILGTAANALTEGKIPNFGLPLFQLAVQKASEGAAAETAKVGAIDSIIGRLQSIYGDKRLAFKHGEKEAYKRMANHLDAESKSRKYTTMQKQALKMGAAEYEKKQLQLEATFNKDVSNEIARNVELNLRTADAEAGMESRMTANNVTKMQALIALEVANAPPEEKEEKEQKEQKPSIKRSEVAPSLRLMGAVGVFKSSIENLANAEAGVPGNLKQHMMTNLRELNDKWDEGDPNGALWSSIWMQSQIIGHYMAQSNDVGNLSEYEQRFWKEIVNMTNLDKFTMRDLIQHMYIFEQDRRGSLLRMWSTFNQKDKSMNGDQFASVMGGQDKFNRDLALWKGSILAMGRKGTKTQSSVPYHGAIPALKGTTYWGDLDLENGLFDGIIPDQAWERELGNEIGNLQKEYYKPPKGKRSGVHSRKIERRSRERWAAEEQLLPVVAGDGQIAYLSRTSFDAFSGLKKKVRSFPKGHEYYGIDLGLSGKRAGGRSAQDTAELEKRSKDPKSGVKKPAKKGHHTKHLGYNGLDINVGGSKDSPVYKFMIEFGPELGVYPESGYEFPHHFVAGGKKKKRKR